jgi:hypothetical protein
MLEQVPSFRTDPVFCFSGSTYEAKHETSHYLDALSVWQTFGSFYSYTALARYNWHFHGDAWKRN